MICFDVAVNGFLVSDIFSLLHIVVYWTRPGQFPWLIRLRANREMITIERIK